MRKISVFLAMCMICTLLLGAVAEPAADNVYDATDWSAVPHGEEEASADTVIGYGNAGDIGGWVSVYCKEWNDIIGPVFGSDLSYDADNLNVIEKRADSATVDIDGIIMDVDYDLNVLSMRVNLSNTSRDTYANLARCLAMVAVLCYDTPTDREGMKNMFMDLMETYLDALEFHNSRAHLYPAGGFSDMAIFLKVVKGSAIFYFCTTDGNLYFSTDDLVE